MDISLGSQQLLTIAYLIIEIFVFFTQYKGHKRYILIKLEVELSNLYVR